MEVPQLLLGDGFDIFIVDLSGGDSVLEFAPSDNLSQLKEAYRKT